MVPKKLFFTKGVGKHKERLTSFELALRDAGIASQNLVRVSSIFPPRCKVIPRKEGLKYLNHGEVVFAVIAENSTREPHRLVVSSIGVAIPADQRAYAAKLCIHCLKAKIAGREVILFVIEWIVRNVHLAVDAGKRSIGIQGDGGVVVKPRRAALKE